MGIIRIPAALHNDDPQTALNQPMEIALNQFVTPATLTETLRLNGYLPETKITEVQRERIGQDLGFNGSLWRLSLSFDSEERTVPKTIIAKFPRNLSVTEKLESEARFYREFRSNIGIRTPRYFVALPEMLLLEDLSHLNCGDVVAGCSAEEAQLFVRHLAKFHATGWMKPSMTNHEWLPGWPNQSEQFYNRFSKFHSIFLERLESVIPSQIRDMTSNLLVPIRPIVDQLSKAPSTLIHKDTHLDNIFFDPPHSVVLIDWPSAAIGPAAVDLTRFMSTSMDAPMRQSIESQLLDEYLDVLHDAGVRNYEREHLRKDVRLAALRLWAGVATGCGASDFSKLVPRQRELWNIETTRMVGFIEDWNIVEFLKYFA